MIRPISCIHNRRRGVFWRREEFFGGEAGFLGGGERIFLGVEEFFGRGGGVFWRDFFGWRVWEILFLEGQVFFFVEI